MTTPNPTPPLPLEEQIARVIDTDAFVDAAVIEDALPTMDEDWRIRTAEEALANLRERQADALTKARQIIALFPKGGSREAVPVAWRWRWTKEAAGLHPDSKVSPPWIYTTDGNFGAQKEVEPLYAHPAPKDRGSEPVYLGVDDVPLTVGDTVQVHTGEVGTIRLFQRGQTKCVNVDFGPEKGGGMYFPFECEKQPPPKDRGEGWREDLTDRLLRVIDGLIDRGFNVETWDLRKLRYDLCLAASPSPRDEALVEEGAAEVIADAALALRSLSCELMNQGKRSEHYYNLAVRLEALSALSTKDMEPADG